MIRPTRSLLAVAALAALLGLTAGCGTKFDLPLELRVKRSFPVDKSYKTDAVWSGMAHVRDIVLTQRYGSQLFVLFERPVPRNINSHGQAYAFPLTRSTPILSTAFQHLDNPAAMTAGGDGTGAPLNRIYVLDQCDTCVARGHQYTDNVAQYPQHCNTDVGGNGEVTDLFHYWRVREYGLLGGETLSTFTDTLMGYVEGIAADYEGRVYVAGSAIVQAPNVENPHLSTRTFESRIYRYVRGGGDVRMPGANWHRDDTWEVVEGSGVGSVQNPHGMQWMYTASGGGLYVSDYDKNWIQRLSDSQSSSGSYQIDGAETGVFLFQAGDVSADEAGFVYVCDTGNQRVLRYDADKNFVQRVDIAEVGGTGPLSNPVAVAANDSLVFIADPGAGLIYKLKRLR
jgi:hypothetical protein